jgi:hypothetical protein
MSINLAICKNLLVWSMILAYGPGLCSSFLFIGITWSDYSITAVEEQSVVGDFGHIWSVCDLFPAVVL